MKTVYAIPNCNTVKKALDWLKANKIAYEFHDKKRKESLQRSSQIG
jgi:arsenate reductase-like glutaredoxin family protein